MVKGKFAEIRAEAGNRRGCKEYGGIIDMDRTDCNEREPKCPQRIAISDWMPYVDRVLTKKEKFDGRTQPKQKTTRPPGTVVVFLLSQPLIFLSSTRKVLRLEISV